MPPPNHRRFQNHRMHLAAFTAILGNLSFGYALVYTSPVIPELEHSLDPQLRLDNYNASFFESIFTLGVIFGGLTTMLLNDLLGRKLTIMLSSVPSVLGFAIMGSAQVVWMLDLGRALTGIAGGMLSGTVPIYIAEISVAKIRGRMGVGPQIMLVLGTLLLYALGLVLSWRWLAIVGAFIPTLMITLMYFMPESPRYLISKHRYSEAMEALAWLRGPEANYRLEYTEIEDSLSSSVSRFSCSELSQRHIYKPMLISVFMRVFQQLSGITVVLVNMQIIFDSTPVILAGRYDAVPVGVVRFFSVLLAAWLMDKAGRRRLLFVSGIIMSISMLSLGVYVKVSELKHNQTSTNMPFENTAHLTAEHLLQHKTTEWSTIIPLISVMVFIFGYAFGWGPITWLMMSEILPLKIRGFASGVCVSVSWITAFILTEFFLQVKHTFGLAVPFLFFCAISILGIIFTAFCIPETRRRTLEQIQDSFQNPRALGC
ncbi:solute carrier family 2, facilitated glucose transporter member 6 isoform X2 [Rhincodon typus]|uniref:solute carrier family 2, facilitated glucose transporter member 6 isoform X2 n=1 Tax=Rhincodon typus TaxID=259920 RepID=UPI00202F07E2|nr:solute carrier family 2, facilitated glucose transporter member 6 isoform X2 [Rhincodon typus]